MTNWRRPLWSKIRIAGLGFWGRFADRNDPVGQVRDGRETRGVHWRTDHPKRDDAQFRAHIVQRRGEPTRLVPLATKSAAS